MTSSDEPTVGEGILPGMGTFLGMIKFSHSIFALPFALIAMLVAAGGWPGTWTVFWIVVACVAARTAAMCFNRVADREFDARNPRTEKRELVTGAISLEMVWTGLLISSIVFFFAAGMLNKTCLYLSPPTLAILLGYSLMKRLTPFTHYFLGLALALAPVGAWIAVTESIAVTPIFLAAAVLCWVAGFDLLYACQDYEADREEPELHSIPKLFGIAKAMKLARYSHALAMLFLLGFWVLAGLGGWFLTGLLGMGALLVYQHRIVSPRDLSRINAAFFTANGLISLLLLLMTVFDLAL